MDQDFNQLEDINTLYFSDQHFISWPNTQPFLLKIHIL